MKTLRENTANFVDQVKDTLDNAYWDTETSHPERSNADCEKVVSYLEGQRFSVKTVKAYLENNWGDIVDFIRAIKTDSISEYPFGNHELAAKYIAHELGYERVINRLSVSLPDSLIIKLIPNN